MPRALIIGGTGPIGRATARRLLASGWQVTLTGRDRSKMPADVARAGGVFARADRSDPGELRAALGSGADLLVDCLCYGAGDAVTLLPLARDAASTVLISAKAVYADALGNHANSPVKPDFGGPVTEDNPTVPPGDAGYGERKVAAERVLLDSGLPVTVIRPGLVHGEGTSMPREWVFVRRALDRRRVVLLAGRGAGVNQPVAAANLAALIETVAGRPGARILNGADPDAPSALEISRIVAGYLGHSWDEVLLGGGEDGQDAGVPGRPGAHPWQAAHPVVLDMAAAAALGYVPAGTYAQTVGGEIDWLVAAAGGRAGGELPPGCDADYFAPLLDYPAEDGYLAALAGQRG